MDFTDAFAGNPQTPVFTAPKGEALRVRFLKPGGHNRNSVPVIHGHIWPRHPFNADSTEIDGNADLTLTCQGLPANQPGIYFYGPNQVSVPFGNGVRCVGGGLVRLPAQSSGTSGTVNRVIDASALPAPISAGETRNFQFWYRDPAAGGAFYNLSGAVAVEFTP